MTPDPLLRSLRDPASMATLTAADWTGMMQRVRPLALLGKLARGAAEAGVTGVLPAAVQRQFAMFALGREDGAETGHHPQLILGTELLVAENKQLVPGEQRRERSLIARIERAGQVQADLHSERLQFSAFGHRLHPLDQLCILFPARCRHPSPRCRQSPNRREGYSRRKIVIEDVS